MKRSRDEMLSPSTSASPASSPFAMDTSAGEGGNQPEMERKRVIRLHKMPKTVFLYMLGVKVEPIGSQQASASVSGGVALARKADAHKATSCEGGLQCMYFSFKMAKKEKKRRAKQQTASAAVRVSSSSASFAPMSTHNPFLLAPYSSSPHSSSSDSKQPPSISVQDRDPALLVHEYKTTDTFRLIEEADLLRVLQRPSLEGVCEAQLENALEVHDALGYRSADGESCFLRRGTDEYEAMELIDDDKRKGVTQQLLTDMFSKMRVSQ